MAKIAIGAGSCQVLADLDTVPEVGETITLRKGDVLGASGFGHVLMGRVLSIVERGETEVGGEMVPHLGISVQIT